MSRLVAVTGAGGLVGGAVARALATRGDVVRRFGRGPGAEGVRFVLGEPVDARRFEGVDVLIHCAWDFAARGFDTVRRVNVDGSVSLFEAARRAGVRRLVLVSSVSADEGCPSDYGRAKRLVEKAAAAAGGVSVRAGLVWSDPPRGLFAALGAMAARLPLLPVFDGGRQPFFLVHADDLGAALAAAPGWEPGPLAGPVAVAHPRPWPFAELLEALAARHGRRLRTVSVPGALALATLRSAEALGLRPPFRSDSLVGLLHTPAQLDLGPALRLGLRLREFPAPPAAAE